MLREEGERSAPGEIGRRLVVATGASVVVEGVLGAGIHVDRIFLFVGGQRRLVGGDAFVDVFIGLVILQEKRRLDRLHHLGRDLHAVVRHRSSLHEFTPLHSARVAVGKRGELVYACAGRSPRLHARVGDPSGDTAGETMPRRPRAAHLENRTARLKLAVRKKPHHFTAISPGIALGYRRCKSAGRWVVKVADGHGGSWTKVVGLADDHENADGEHILTWWQAQDKARTLARGKDAGGRPITVAEALADYERDLIARSASPTNARRARHHLPPALAAKPVSLLTPRELKLFRDGLVGKLKP